MLGTIVAVKLSMIYGLVTYLFFAAFIIVVIVAGFVFWSRCRENETTAFDDLFRPSAVVGIVPLEIR